MKLKKLAALVLAGAMMLSMAACGSDGASTGGSGAGTGGSASGGTSKTVDLKTADCTLSNVVYRNRERFQPSFLREGH